MSVTSTQASLLAPAMASVMVVAACGAEPANPAMDPGQELPCLQSLSTYQGDDPLSYSVAWSPRSDHVLGGTEHELRLMAVEDEGRSLRVADRFVGGQPFMSIDWTADGTRALAAGGDGRVHLFEVDLEAESLTLLTSVEIDARGLFDVRLSPDERHALVCGEQGFLSLVRVDAAAAELRVVDRFAAHRRCVVARWAPSGTHAASLGPDQSTFFYRVDPEAERIEAIAVMRSGEEPGAVAFGEDDSEVVLGTFGASHRLSYLRLDTVKGQLQEHQVLDDFASGLKVIEPAHDPAIYVIAAHDGAPRLYHRTEEPGLEQIFALDDDGSGSHDIGWSPDDRFLVRAASQLDRFEVLGTEGCAAP